MPRLARFIVGLTVFTLCTAPWHIGPATAGRLDIDVSPFGQDSTAPDDAEETDAVVPGESLESGSPALEPAPGTNGEATLLPTPNIPSRFSETFKQEGAVVKPEPEVERLAEELDLLPPISIVRDDKVEGHIRYFQTAIRDRFEQWLTRLAHYRPLVADIFSEFNLPSDLVYLSLVESGFNPHAYSRARAMGPWQFMKGTARLYGLRVDRYVDERRDPIKSTIAAARYLRDLYDLFGAWPLAMAAYNAGEGKVMRALQKARADSFGEIARTKHLRRETKEYVPRFMAATIIAKNPDQFGFIQEPPPPHDFEEVIVGRSVHLQAVAAASGVSFYELRRLNPELRLDATPPDDRSYHLKVPVGTRGKVEQALERVPSWKPSAVIVVKKTKNRLEPKGDARGSYRVRVGDSLWTIAKRFNLTVAQLKARNAVATRGIRPGDLLTIGPR